VITGYGDQTRLDVERSEKRNCAMALVVMDYVGSAPLFEVQPRLGPIKTGLPPNRADTQSMPLQIMDQNHLSRCNQLEASPLLLEFRA